MTSPSDSLVTLRDYVDTRFDATNLAIQKAEFAADRLHNISNDIANRMMPRAEYSQSHKALENKIDVVAKVVWMGLGAVTILQVAIGVAVLIWKR